MSSVRDGEALLRAIRADPADDFPRLLYADWCEESGQGERAEFIRAQLALASLRSECGSEGGDWLCRSISCEMCPQIRRQNKAWLEMPLTKDYIPPVGFAVTIFAGPDHPAPVVHIRRGWVQSAQCTHAQWVQHGQAIKRWHPVERVTLVDREPEHVNGCANGASGWTFFVGEAAASRHHIPNAVWRHMPSTWYPTREAALDALSDACVLYATPIESPPHGMG